VPPNFKIFILAMLLNKKRLPLFGGRRPVGFYVFYTIRYLPPCFTPVAVVVVVVV
jgi:hypothetical protein